MITFPGLGADKNIARKTMLKTYGANLYKQNYEREVSAKKTRVNNTSSSKKDIFEQHHTDV